MNENCAKPNKFQINELMVNFQTQLCRQIYLKSTYFCYSCTTFFFFTKKKMTFCLKKKSSYEFQQILQFIFFFLFALIAMLLVNIFVILQ